MCVVGGEEAARDVARFVCVQLSDDLGEKLIAVVFCQGDSGRLVPGS